ncbi:MFS transporter [Erwinia tasmaniensis]|uniref:Membrane protein n=1 Tax=Erwinia tasmaniensis (strain DSM 17950 / CFBP 7177 / CIP 109463 / NCPPB 4357 / Et1/99) TaxID=465817 RepID=B2VDD7_ERWT9|nr:MFS transporter [Erwinia tasmaniensis]CAO97944.1 Putative membrane protein [Erwinia tasmaniensis Et1/99]
MFVTEKNAVSPINKPIAATRKAFFIAGFSLASWAPLIPLTKERLQVDNGMMGIIMLAFGLGSLLMMPLSGMLAARFGCRRIFTLALLLVLATLPALVTLDTVVPLALALFIFGAGIGAMDVVVSIHAVIVEKYAQKPIMSGFHALFSLGGIAGAAAVSLLLSWGVPPFKVVMMVIALLGSIMLLAWSGLMDEKQRRDTPFFVLPKGSVLLLGLLCCVAYVMEGSMLDWSGILLISQHNVDVRQAGLGYTLFAITMTVGRLLGDRVIKTFGAKRIFIGSALLATSGFIVLIVSNALFITALAFLLIGLGVANIAPMLFTASGQQKDMPDALAVAAVSSLGYSGILMGPAVIGFVAHLSSLIGAFIFVTLLSIILLMVSRRVRLTS